MTTPYQSYWGKGLRYSNGFGKDFFSDLKDIAVDIWHIATGKVSKFYSNAYGTDTVADLKDMGVTFIHMLQTNVLLLALAVMLVVSWPLYQVVNQAAQKPASVAPISAPVIVPSQTETLAPTAVPTSTPTVIPSPTVTSTPAFVLPPIDPNPIYWADLFSEKRVAEAITIPISKQDLQTKVFPNLPLDRSMTWGYHGGGFTGDYGCWFVYPWPRVRGYDLGFSVCQNRITTILLDGIFYDDLYKIVKPITDDMLNGSVPDIGAPEQ